MSTFDVLLVDVKRFAIDQEGRLVFLELANGRGLRLRAKESGVLKGKKITLDTGEITFAIHRKPGGHDVGLVLSTGGARLATYLGLGRMVGFAALAKDSEVQKARVKILGRDAEVYKVAIDLGKYGLSIEGQYIDVGGGARILAHTLVKDLTGSLLVAQGKVPPNAIATEVPLHNYLERAPLQGKLREEVAAAYSIKKKEPLIAARLKQKGAPRLDLLGISKDGRLVLGQVKAWNEAPDRFDLHLATIYAWGRAAGEYIRILVDAYNGRALGGEGKGEGAYTLFAWPGPMPPVPDLREPYLYVYAKFKVESGKIETYITLTEATAGELTDIKFLEQVARWKPT